MSVPPPPMPYGPPPYGQQPYGQQPYGQPPYGPPVYPYGTARPPTSAWAVVSLVFGVIGGVLISVVAGIVALRKTKDGRQSGRNLAIAGLALSGVWTLALTALAVFIVNDDSVRPTSLQTGDCLKTIPSGDWVLSIDAVTCDQPHTGEVFATIVIPDGDYPGDSVIASYQDQCGPAMAEWFPEAMTDDSIGLYLLYPTEETWQAGDRSVTCIATTDDARTGSLRG